MGWDFDFLRRLQHIGIIVINMKHRAPQTRWTNDGLFDALALSYRLTSAVSVSTGRLGLRLLPRPGTTHVRPASSELHSRSSQSLEFLLDDIFRIDGTFSRCLAVTRVLQYARSD